MILSLFTCVYYLALEVPLKGNAEGTKHFLWQSLTSLNSCMAPNNKMTLCQVWLGGKSYKFLVLTADGY